jgi:hypothetical protein
MDENAVVLIGVALVVITALAAWAAYRGRQRARVRRVKEWVKGYLVTRYGAVPDGRNINCSDDPRWPVLVAFDRPLAGPGTACGSPVTGPRLPSGSSRGRRKPAREPFVDRHRLCPRAGLRDRPSAETENSKGVAGDR